MGKEIPVRRGGAAIDETRVLDLVINGRGFEANKWVTGWLDGVFVLKNRWLFLRLVALVDV